MDGLGKVQARGLVWVCVWVGCGRGVWVYMWVCVGVGKCVWV